MNFFLQLLIQGIGLGTVYALVAQGMTVTLWTVGVASFAHGAFMMFGAFIAIALAGSGIPVLIAVLISVAALALLAIPLERVAVRPVVRTGGALGWIVSTLGASLVLEGVAESIFGPDPRPFPTLFFSDTDYLKVFGVNIPLQILLIAGVSVAILLLFQVALRRTAFGVVLKAVSDDPESALLRGINVERVVIASFIISGGLAALAGVLIAPVTGVSPSFGFMLLLSGFAAIVVGGIRSAVGIFVGGIIVGVSELMVGGYVSTAAQSGVALAVVIVILMAKPSGLFGKNEVVKV